MLEYVTDTAEYATDTAVLVLQLKKQTNMQHALLNRTKLNPALLEYLQLPSNFSPYLYERANDFSCTNSDNIVARMLV